MAKFVSLPSCESLERKLIPLSLSLVFIELSILMDVKAEKWAMLRLVCVCVWLDVWRRG